MEFYKHLLSLYCGLSVPVLQRFLSVFRDWLLVLAVEAAEAAESEVGRGVKRMQNQDGVLWGFLFSLNLQYWHLCATSVEATYHSHTKTRNVRSLHWASLVLCDSKPFRSVSSPCSEVRGSLGNVCRASQCFLYCPGLAQKLGSCSPPGRKMQKAEEMVL